MTEAILVLNAGSSSIKFALFELGAEIKREPALSGQIEGIGQGAGALFKAQDVQGKSLVRQPLQLDASKGSHEQALAILLDWLDHNDDGMTPAAVGHRVVHGGTRYRNPVRVDTTVLEALRSYIPLAPLHQPHNLEAIAALARLKPTLPQVACFDTAFHATQPPLAQEFALPRAITAQGVRRYGFHGLSYEYIADILPEHVGDAADGRVVVAHLGNGASMCAMKARQSVATTMGFTALDGLMMGTRSGSVDPGVLLYLMEHEGMDASRLAHLLYHESGLLGVSGISADMRELLASGEREAQHAVDLFCYRIARELGSLAAALNGLDVLVFTAGIGEHAAPVRERVCAAAGWLGVELDHAANIACTGDALRISSGASQVDVWVLPTNEEWMIARHTQQIVAA